MSAGDDIAISLSDVEQAADRIRCFVPPTPTLESDVLNGIVGARVVFKCENLTATGAFKIRGATNALLQLDDAARERGVAAHSSGNHAGAVAKAAKRLGVPAWIVMPRGAPQCKRDAVTRSGATLIECEPTIASREATCASIVREKNLTFIPPYNHPHVMAGQGTIAVELLEQHPDIGLIVAPISGGGMVSGIAVAAKARTDGRVTVLAAECCGLNDAADAYQSKKAGRLVECAKPETIADGLQAQLGSLTWPCVRDLVDDVLVVTEEGIKEAVRLILRHLKVSVEPSGAVGLAALMTEEGRKWVDKVAREGGRVSVVLSGGNVDLHVLAGILGEDEVVPSDTC